MRIGIDTHFITSEPATGNCTYTSQLVMALVAAGERNDYVLYAADDHCFYHQLSENPRVRVRRVLSKNGLIRNNISLPRSVARDRLNIAFFQYILPPFTRVPSVVTIHDLYYLHSPLATSYQRALMWLALWSARRADHVTTPSAYSKNEIVTRAGIDPRRVTVTPEGVDGRFAPSGDSDKLTDLRKRLGIQGPYILFVGRTEDPRKNIPTLVRAYAAIVSSREISEQLVIAGRHGAGTAAIRALVRELGLEHKVLLTGAVPDADLPTLYSGATMFVYVSSFEGFGLPVLEAMASGTPVITSNVTSLPEVAGDAAVLVPPASVDALVSAMRRLLDNPAIGQDLRVRGLARARKFTWERTAGQMLAIFNTLEPTREAGSSGWQHRSG